jgi:hypothetical protein
MNIEVFLEEVHSQNHSASELAGFLEEVRSNNGLLNDEFVEANVVGLRFNEWDNFSRLFSSSRMFGPTGIFLMACPHKVVRGGTKSWKMSGVFGRLKYRRLFPKAFDFVQKAFGETRQQPSEVIAIEQISSAGSMRGDHGEAFLVPESYPFKLDVGCPVVNLSNIQKLRFDRLGRDAINAIFSATTASLLLGLLGNDEELIRHSEYELHDVGHASGIGLIQKIRARTLRSIWSRAVEEWRADGVGIGVARDMFQDETKTAEIISSNLCTRFGIDAHRYGGFELDSDVNSTMLTMQSLIEGGVFYVDQDLKLSLKRNNVATLIAAADLMVAQTRSLTSKELRIKDPSAVDQLYGWVGLSESAVTLFRAVVSRCQITNRLA